MREDGGHHGPTGRIWRGAGGSHRERRHLRIDDLPGNLSEALDELEKDDLVRETLGDHIFEHFLTAKRDEWHDYIRHVSPWEAERYLGVY